MVRTALYRLFQFGLVFALLLSMERRAYAYIDPGVGLGALQAVSATVFGVLYFLRGRIKRLFQNAGMSFPKNPKDTTSVE